MYTDGVPFVLNIVLLCVHNMTEIRTHFRRQKSIWDVGLFGWNIGLS